MKTARTPRFDNAWHKAIAMYPDEKDRRALTEAIRKYQLDGVEPDLPPVLMVAFAFLRPTIDRRRRNAEKARNRREAKKKKEEKTAVTNNECKIRKPVTDGVAGSPMMLTDLYGSRLENDRARLLSIASETGRKCRKNITVDDVVRNISFFNDYLFRSADKVDSEEAYMKRFIDFFINLMRLPSIGSSHNISRNYPPA